MRPAPADAPTTFARHSDFVLLVRTDVRELADSQFRFVTGFAGQGTEAIRSVNWPDRNLRAVDGAVRLEPFEAGGAFTAQASLHRAPAGRGIALRLAGDATRVPAPRARRADHRSVRRASSAFLRS